jgi:hypothetical protein
MYSFFILLFIITALISYFWVTSIDETIKYQKENPDADLSEGWLDWDLKKKLKNMNKGFNSNFKTSGDMLDNYSKDFKYADGTEISDKTGFMILRLGFAVITGTIAKNVSPSKYGMVALLGGGIAGYFIGDYVAKQMQAELAKKNMGNRAISNPSDDQKALDAIKEEKTKNKM